MQQRQTQKHLWQRFTKRLALYEWLDWTISTLGETCVSNIYNMLYMWYFPVKKLSPQVKFLQALAKTVDKNKRIVGGEQMICNFQCKNEDLLLLIKARKCWLPLSHFPLRAAKHDSPDTIPFASSAKVCRKINYSVPICLGEHAAQVKNVQARDTFQLFFSRAECDWNNNTQQIFRQQKWRLFSVCWGWHESLKSQFGKSRQTKSDGIVARVLYLAPLECSAVGRARAGAYRPKIEEVFSPTHDAG